MNETIDIKINKVKESRIKSIDFNNIVFGTVYSDHMFVADYYDGKWQNFSIEPYAPLSLSPGNAVLHYGQSIFEGLKAYKAADGSVQVFRPEANAERLNTSAERMCIPEVPQELFMTGLKELLSIDKGWVPKSKGASLYIRPYVFAMDEYIGIRPSNTYKFIIFTCPVGAYYSEPVNVKIETHFTRATPGGTGFAKAAGNYAGSLYPAKLAQKEGYHQLIWTDALTHEYIEESGTMNVMFIVDGKLITAQAGDTILNGITRNSVLTLAREWGIEVVEGPVAVKDIVKAAEEGRLEEAFGTGTAATIAQIQKIGYNGTDYELPPVEQREFSNKVLEKLDAIKYGEEPDNHGWILKI
ncbi:branched-chain amino acid aminotransferase [Aureibacter tunicatorum]|uniref:branched-chain-amino-acid transaminase n=1 Tax=Aureibacter tunicatorum TaxID=866807 RepID=A0AAE3XKX4_9BACT|nr:branched-chain amino acid aminotransferase [Aureibacter tunicatorum]MDR6238415.1 branched-chain amino acid aminotransferase [Aureibacter tunicatorum]BDD03447.1 branched-chain-amino-acid aminotransferase [Aureibacter tunicatorum]